MRILFVLMSAIFNIEIHAAGSTSTTYTQEAFLSAGCTPLAFRLSSDLC